MARKPPSLAVIIMPRAQRDLTAIWDYNCDTYNPDHADKYANFLADRTAALATEFLNGKVVPSRPDFRSFLMRKGRGHGHIAIYQIINDTVEVLHYFHTAQDWQSKL